MKQLLIATTNPGKFNEIKHFLKDLPLELINVETCRRHVSTQFDEPVEDGLTFEENAILKAKYYFAKTGIPTIADDGGIEIDYFNGEPGVKSKRWIGGKETSDEELINYTLKKMKGVPISKRGAQLHTVVALALSNEKIFIEHGRIRGIIVEKVGVYTPGYPYRSLFYLPQIKKYYDHQVLTKEEYEKYGHRGQAVRKLAAIIKREYL